MTLIEPKHCTESPGSAICGNDLKQEIASLISSQGPITFARYMELALYHPTKGYYMNSETKLGRGGDFYTSSHVHSVFGETLALQIMEMDRQLSASEFTLIEYGGGMGYLAGDILSLIRSENPQLFEGLKYIFIEKSPQLKVTQQEYLESLGLKEKARWFDNPANFAAGIEDLSQTSGCIIANEVLDAMPVHRITRSTRGLKEIFVTYEKGKLKEQMGGLSSRVRAHLTRYPLKLAVGQELEICPDAHEWLEEAAKLLGRGFMVVFDYGYELKEMADSLRYKGTIIGYREHGIINTLFDEPGKTDITAHVNFTTLKQKGMELGLRDLGLLYQLNFLMNAGIISRIHNLKSAQAMKHLVLPGGMGTTFRVQGFAKGISTTPKGFIKSN